MNRCSNHTCQFGVCIKNMNGYTCKCNRGYTGQFCEKLSEREFIAKQSKISLIQCTPNICSNNGICYKESNDMIRCRCLSGFIGDRCTILKSVHSKTNNSYIKLSKPNIYPYLNMTIVFRTIKTNGILVYFGYIGHLIVELFMGRIRISYGIRHSPGSVVFSYNTVNDGEKEIK